MLHQEIVAHQAMLSCFVSIRPSGTRRTEHDVESMHLDEGLGIDRIGEASKLGYSTEVRHEVFLNLRSPSGLADILIVLQILSEAVPE